MGCTDAHQPEQRVDLIAVLEPDRSPFQPFQELEVMTRDLAQ